MAVRHEGLRKMIKELEFLEQGVPRLWSEYERGDIQPGKQVVGLKKKGERSGQRQCLSRGLVDQSEPQEAWRQLPATIWEASLKTGVDSGKQTALYKCLEMFLILYRQLPPQNLTLESKAINQPTDHVYTFTTRHKEKSSPHSDWFMWVSRTRLIVTHGWATTARLRVG